MRLILVSYTLYLPMCHSLKEKRKIVRSLKDSLKAKFNVSVAEVDYHDLHQSAKLAVAVVFSESSSIDSCLSKIDSHVRNRFGYEVTSAERSEF